jgi:hypothetical protein
MNTKKGSTFYVYRKRVARLASGSPNMNIRPVVFRRRIEERKSLPPPRL